MEALRGRSEALPSSPHRSPLFQVTASLDAQIVVIVSVSDPGPQIAEEAGIEVSYPLTLMVDNAAGESFCKSTSGLSKLRGVYQMRDSRIKELRDAKIVTAKHVDTKLNLADRLI